MSRRDEDHVPLPTGGGHGASVWILFLAGPTIWFTHFMLVYVLAEVLCKPLRTETVLAGLPLVSFLTVVATVIGAAAALVLALVAYRRWRGATSDSAPAADDGPHGPGEALMLAGFLLGILFFVAVLFTGAPALVLQPC